MHFCKLTLVFLGVLFFGASVFFAATTAYASAPINSTFSATASTGVIGTIRQVRVDPANDSVYVLGSSTDVLGIISADGSTFNSISYSVALPAHSASDMAVYHGNVFLVINGATNATYRYNVSEYTATLAASRALATGSSAITIDSDGTTVYASKGLNAYSLDTSLNPLVPTSTLSASASRLAYGGGTLFSLSTTGRFARVVLGVSDTTIATGGPTASNIKGLGASNDGGALYYASTSTLAKISATTGSILWTKPVSNIAGIDVQASTGRITLIDSSGAVNTYNPINPLSSVSASASGTSANLNWTTGISDSDFSGVTIRRSTSGYPETVSDGVAVTSSSISTSFIDTGLDEGTYYYSFFNQTSDGYYSAAVTSTVTIDLPPHAFLYQLDKSMNHG